MLEPVGRVLHTDLGSIGGWHQEELPARQRLVLLRSGLVQECTIGLCVAML